MPPASVTSKWKVKKEQMWSHCFPSGETPTTATPITQVTDQQCPSHMLPSSNAHHTGYRAATSITQVIDQQHQSHGLQRSNVHLITQVTEQQRPSYHTGYQTQHLFRIFGND